MFINLLRKRRRKARASLGYISRSDLISKKKIRDLEYEMILKPPGFHMTDKITEDKHLISIRIFYFHWKEIPA